MARRRDDGIDPQDLERLVKQEKAHLQLEKERLFQEVQRKLDEYVAGGGTVLDLSGQMHNQYLTGRQAEIWLEIEGDAGLAPLADVLERCREKVPSLKQVKSIVDYGVGSGKKAARAYTFFNKNHDEERGTLHGIDISPLMISNAWEEWGRQGIDNILLHQAVAFESLGQLDPIERDRYDKLHLFLGQTIGNFDDPVRVVKNIARNMRKGEHLLLEWFCREPKDFRDQEGKFEKLYRELFSITKMPQKAIGGYDPHIDEGQEWNVMSFTVRDVPKEKRTFTLNGKTYTLQPETEIKVSRSRRFKEEEVVGICEKAGLEAIEFDAWAGDSPIDFKAYAETIEPVYPPSSAMKRKWIPLQDRRYGLFRKDRDEDQFSRGLMNGMGIAAGIASLSYLLFSPLQAATHRYLWRNAAEYHAQASSAPVDVEQNLHELRAMLDPSCKGIDWRLACTKNSSRQQDGQKADCDSYETLIDYTKIQCDPLKRDSYVELEHHGDMEIDARWGEIQDILGVIPDFKQYGAVIINGSQMLLLEKSNVRIFVQLLEDARREIVQQEARGPKERYQGNNIYGMVNYQEVADGIPGVITFFSEFLDIDGSQIAFKLYQADIGSECGNPRLKDGYFALDFEKGDTFEARIHHFYNPSIVARGVYTWHSGGTVHTDPDGPAMSSTRAMSCTATFAINTHRSKARNDDAARHIVDILQTVRSKYEKQKGTGPH